MGSLGLLVDWTQHLPCNDDFVVPLLCRPTFLDYTTFEMATRLGRLTADPTNYTDLEGGIYYRSTNERLYYRNATEWVPLGLGDGDVIFDPAGTAQQDNGVARWSTTSKYIQGSLATLDDSGNFLTPGRYETTNDTLSAQAFVSRNADFSTEFQIDHAGTMQWRTSGSANSVFGYLETNVIGSERAGQQIALRNGDSRMSAQRILSGKGNAQNNSDFRCPLVAGTCGTFNYPGAADGEEFTFFDETIPAGGLAAGDMLHVKLILQTSNGAMTKHIKFYVGSGANTVSIATAGGTVYYVHLDFWLTRLTTGGFVGEIMATQQGAFVGTLDPHTFNGSWDFDTTPLNLVIVGFCGTTAGPYAADSFIVNGGFVEYKCL